MFKKLLSLSAIMLAGATLVSAQSPYYAGVSALAGKSGKFTKLGGAAQFGYNISNDVAAEFELGQLFGDAKKTEDDAKYKLHLNETFIMGNVRYKGTYSCVNYAVFAGLGADIAYGHIKGTNLLTGEKNKSSLTTHVRLAAQVGASVGMNITDALSANIGARLFFAPKYRVEYFDGSTFIATKAVTPMLEASLNYAF